MYQSRSNYTKGELLRCFSESYPARPKKEIQSVAAKLANELALKVFDFPAPSVISRGGKRVYLFNDWRPEILLLQVDKKLRQAYGIHFPDRNQIIEQLIGLFSARSFSRIIRTDISGFFESINYANLLEKLSEEKQVCNQTIQLLYSLKKCLPADFSGLPRGFSIASTLAEIEMLKLDRSIRSMDGVHFYCRYVDDILILSHSSETDQLEQVEKEVVEIGLTLNEDKTQVVDIGEITDRKVGYLGYQFMFPDASNGNSMVKVTVHPSKLNRIKTRIIQSLLAYGQDNDFEMLRDRILFLADTSPVFDKDSRVGKVRTGLFFNYQFINDTSQLKELDQFKAAAIYSKKNSFSRKATNALTLLQKRELAKISFVAGFLQKRRNAFSPQRMTLIMRVFK